MDVNAVSGSTEILNHLVKEAIDTNRNLTQELIEKSVLDHVQPAEAAPPVEPAKNPELGRFVDYSV